MGADFYACSPYKFLGPHCGAVFGRTELLHELRPDKLLPSPDRVPERFEYGTLAYELMAGTTAAIDFLAGMTAAAGNRRQRLVAAMTAVHHHEDDLRVRLETAVAALPGVTVHSRAQRRTPTLLLTFTDVRAETVGAILADADINAPAGSFYAYEASRRLGLGDAGGLRVGLAPYTNSADIDRLVTALSAAVGQS